MVSPRMWGVILTICALAPVATGAGWFGGAAQTPKTAREREPEMYEQAAEHFTAFFLSAESWTIPGLSVAVPLLDFVLTLDTCTSYRRHQGSKSHPWLQVRRTHQQHALPSPSAPPSTPLSSPQPFNREQITFGGSLICAGARRLWYTRRRLKKTTCSPCEGRSNTLLTQGWRRFSSRACSAPSEARLCTRSSSERQPGAPPRTL